MNREGNTVRKDRKLFYKHTNITSVELTVSQLLGDQTALGALSNFCGGRVTDEHGLGLR